MRFCVKKYQGKWKAGCEIIHGKRVFVMSYDFRRQVGIRGFRAAALHLPVLASIYIRSPFRWLHPLSVANALLSSMDGKRCVLPDKLTYFSSPSSAAFHSEDLIQNFSFRVCSAIGG